MTHCATMDPLPLCVLGPGGDFRSVVSVSGLGRSRMSRVATVPCDAGPKGPRPRDAMVGGGRASTETRRQLADGGHECPDGGRAVWPQSRKLRGRDVAAYQAGRYQADGSLAGHRWGGWRWIHYLLQNLGWVPVPQVPGPASTFSQGLPFADDLFSLKELNVASSWENPSSFAGPSGRCWSAFFDREAYLARYGERCVRFVRMFPTAETLGLWVTKSWSAFGPLRWILSGIHRAGVVGSDGVLRSEAVSRPHVTSRSDTVLQSGELLNRFDRATGEARERSAHTSARSVSSPGHVDRDAEVFGKRFANWPPVVLGPAGLTDCHDVERVTTVDSSTVAMAGPQEQAVRSPRTVCTARTTEVSDAKQTKWKLSTVDTETVANLDAHPGFSAQAWLFPDDAGVGRRNRRHQSYRVRTRRQPRKERSFAPFEAQGSLFGAYAAGGVPG